MQQAAQQAQSPYLEDGAVPLREAQDSSKELVEGFLRAVARKQEWTRGEYVDAHVRVAEFPCGCPLITTRHSTPYASDQQPTGTAFRLFADDLRLIHLGCRNNKLAAKLRPEQLPEGLRRWLQPKLVK